MYIRKMAWLDRLIQIELFGCISTFSLYEYLWLLCYIFSSFAVAFWTFVMLGLFLYLARRFYRNLLSPFFISFFLKFLSFLFFFVLFSFAKESKYQGNQRSKQRLYVESTVSRTRLHEIIKPCHSAISFFKKRKDSFIFSHQRI